MLGIVNYSDSDGSSSEDEIVQSCNTKPTKRKCDVKEKSNVKKKMKLPLPTSIDKMFADKELKDNNESHKGRSRNFDHVEGNWATYVFIPLIETNNVNILYNFLCTMLRKEYSSDVNFFPLKDCHISLSRTVAVRHYWIDTLFLKLKERFASTKQFFYSLTELKVYNNDEKTRTFVSLEVSVTNDFLKAMENVNEVFQEFDLQEYYKNPSFHISFAWLLGDRKEEVENLIQKEQKTILSKFSTKINFGLHHNLAEKICMKCGNRIFQLFFEGS